MKQRLCTEQNGINGTFFAFLTMDESPLQSLQEFVTCLTPRIVLKALMLAEHQFLVSPFPHLPPPHSTHHYDKKQRRNDLKIHLYRGSVLSIFPCMFFKLHYLFSFHLMGS
jgi:hypothetical protein